MKDIDAITGDVVGLAMRLHRELGPGFPAAFRIDLLVDERLLLEIKSVERLIAVHAKQLLTYLRLTGQPVGLLINFGLRF